MTYYNPYNAPYRGANTMNPNFSVNLSSFSGGTSSGTGQSGDTQGAEEATAAGGGFANAMNKGMAVAGGVASLYNTYQDLASIADTSAYWNSINDVKNVGKEQYSDFSTLLQDYGRLEDLQTSYDYNKIRGKNDGQMAMGIGNAMLQGASAGMAFGPYGAAAGAAIGLGTGIAGMLAGNAKAKEEQRWLQDSAIMAEHSATANLDAGHEQLRDYQFRSGISNRADWGGKIERKQQSIKEFAANALKKPHMREHGPSKRFVRSHRDGGTVVKIKR